MIIWKILKISAIAIVILVVVLVAAAVIYHQVKLNREADKYPPPGQLVNIENTKLHVFAAGNGDETLVFLSGHGTSNPVLDFIPLWKRLEEEYRIVIPERAGYGWSETSGVKRDIETILHETRESLRLAGESGPYILVAHSMAGLEAIYWAQKYPDEIKMIIGLDPTTPAAVRHLPEPPKAQLYAMYAVSRMGLSRFMPEAEVQVNLPLMGKNELNAEEKEQYMALFYKSAFTRNMLREVNYLSDNAKTVESLPVPVNIPMYFFISHDEMVEGYNWQDLLIGYIDNLEYGEYLLLDTGHYLHYEKAETITGEISRFIEK